MMSKLDKYTNIAGIAFFGGLALAGLYAAIFVKGATHQLVTVAIGAVMVLVLWAEVRRGNKEAKQTI